MSIAVTFACGHRQSWGDSEAAPCCVQCGERQVSRVKTRPPTFRGAVRGPLAVAEPLAGIVLDLAPSGSLVLTGKQE